jgi:hypothetical protein
MIIAAQIEARQMTYSPPVEVPADLVEWMRSRASGSAFLASMLDLIRRKGGLTQNQIDMVRDEQARNSN